MIHLFVLTILGALSFGNIGESKMKDTNESEGVQYIKLDNGYKVWTQRVGHGPIKILTLHGGPGCTHEYLKCLVDFFPEDQFQIIFYDQLGSYHSDQPNDPSLWRVERFCDEVEQVRKALGLENFYLYGQSWGGMLAIEYTLKYQQHLKGLILSNITGSIDSYVAYLHVLRSKFPHSLEERLKFYEDKEDFLNPEYEKIMMEEVYTNFLCRLKPWPEALLQTFKHLNTQVYHTMQGPNEFLFTGNLKEWDRWNDLPNIKVPTLVICGRYDTMSAQDNERMAQLIPKSTIKICENGSHCPFYDDLETYFQTLHRFIAGVENDSKFALKRKDLQHLKF